MARGHRPFLLTAPVNTEAHDGIVVVSTRLDMNIGRPDFVRIIDELTHEAHDRTVAFFPSRLAHVIARIMPFGREFTEKGIKAHFRRVRREIDTHRFDDFENVFFESHDELGLFSRKHAADVTKILSRVWVINQDVHRVRGGSERNPTIGVQIRGGNPPHHLKVEVQRLLWIKKGTLIIRA